MNSKFKRLLACLLSLMMVISIFPLSAFAAEEDEIDTISESSVVDGDTWGGIDWTLTTDGTLTIAPTDNELTTPKHGKTSEVYERGQLPVGADYAIKNYYTPWKKADVKKLVLKDGVTSIGSFVFDGGYPNLTSEIVIPYTVTYIGMEAFKGTLAEKITFAEVPEGQIGKELCVAQGAFKNLVVEDFALPADRPVHVHVWQFLNSKNLKNITFPATLTGVTSAHHVDWLGNPNKTNGAGAGSSAILNTTNTSLETITFGSKAVYDLVTKVDNSFIKNFGGAYVTSSVDAIADGDAPVTYCKNLAVAASVAQPGDTITLLKNTDETVYLPAGVDLATNGFSAPNAKIYVAMVNGQGYETLAKAIAAATAGAEITLLADVNENVTINKNLTIDGNNFKYTGTMTLSTKINFTVQNVNFVKGTIVKGKNTTVGGDYTIKNCNFDGQGLGSYAVDLRGTSAIVIENVTAKNYAAFLQVPSSNVSVTVKNSQFTDMTYYGFKIDYSNGVTMENVTVNAGQYAIYHSNFGYKIYSIKNCTLNGGETGIKIWERPANEQEIFKFEGANQVSSMSESQYVTYELTAGATLTAPADLTITTSVEDGRVAYKDGKYYVQVGLAGSGTEEDPYQINDLVDLIKFRDSVNAGETKYNAEGVYVVLTADIDLAGENWVAIGSATQDHGFMGNFDGNGFKIKNLTIDNPELDSDGYAYAGFFGITEGTDKNNQNVIKNLVIENVTISTTGHIVAGAIAYPYYTILENITVCGNIAIEGGDYTAGVLAYTRRCTTASNITISGNAGSYITGVKTVGGVISDIQMNGGLTANYSNFSASGLTITGDMHVGGISGIICNQTLNGATVKNVKLVCSDARVGVVAGSLGGTATIKNVETSKVTGTKNIVGADFSNGKAVANKDDQYGIATAWINKVGYFITLADAVEYVNGLNKTSLTYIDLLRDSEGPGFVVKAPVQIEFNGYTYTITKGVGSTGTESNGIQQLSGNLVLKKGALKVADSIADKMYILIQSYDDLTVTGMTLDGTNLDKWSKHEDQVVNGDSYVVSKNNGNFAINTSNIITNDDGSKAFAFDLCDQRSKGYMDLPYASVAATTTINGAPVKESLDKVEAVANYSTYYYATIEQAIAKHPSAALIGDVVLKDTVVVPAGKTFTLDLNGHTITMKTAEYKSAIENNGTLTIKDSGENGGIAMIFTGTASTAKAVNAISNRGKLTVQGGNISNSGNGNQIGYAIDNYNGATLTVKGGNITASGSTYYDAIRLFCGSKETKVTVSGGYVSSIWAQNPSANKASEVNGSVVVTGGEIGTIYYENYTTVTITTKIAGNYNVVAYGANSENATSAKVAKNTVYSFAN